MVSTVTNLSFKIYIYKNHIFSFLSYTNIHLFIVPCSLERRETMWLKIVDKGSSTLAEYYRVSEGFSSDNEQEEDLNPSPKLNLDF